MQGITLVLDQLDLALIDGVKSYRKDQINPIELIFFFIFFYSTTSKTVWYNTDKT